MGDFYIGGYASGSPNTQFFNGTIDEVAVYSDAISGETLGSHFVTGAGRAPSQWDAYAALVATTPSVQAWWRLNENSGAICMDHVGSSHGTKTGTWTNGVSLVQGAPDRSITLNGGYIDCGTGTNTSLPPPTFAIEALIKPTSLPSTGMYTFVISKDEAYELFLAYNGALGFRACQPDAVAWNTMATPAGVVVANGIYYVIANNDGTNMHLFVNNVERASVTAANTYAASNYPMYIGGRASVGTFRGSIDEVALYSDALTRDEIGEHFRLGAGGTLDDDVPVQSPAGPPAGAVTSDDVEPPYSEGTGVELTEDLA